MAVLDHLLDPTTGFQSAGDSDTCAGGFDIGASHWETEFSIGEPLDAEVEWEGSVADLSDSEMTGPEITAASIHFVVDQTLATAARESRESTNRLRPDNRGLATAIVLALLFHIGLVAACFAMVVTIRRWLPRAEFTKGSGSSESGLISDQANDANAQTAGVPGPMLVIPNPPKASASQEQSVAEELPPREQIESKKTLRDFAPAHEASDSAIIGPGIDPVGAMPRWHRPDSPALPSPTVTHPLAGPGAMDSAPATAVRHVLAPPRGLGHNGSAAGDQGSGFDSDGLPKPVYPPESIRRHEVGTVEFDVLVNADGSIGSVKMAKDSGYTRLNQSALAALRSARFAPATADGKPVAVWIRIPFQFIQG
jgi:TonB family protein